MRLLYLKALLSLQRTAKNTSTNNILLRKINQKEPLCSQKSPKCRIKPLYLFTYFSFCHVHTSNILTQKGAKMELKKIFSFISIQEMQLRYISEKRDYWCNNITFQTLKFKIRENTGIFVTKRYTMMKKKYILKNSWNCSGFFI